MNNVSNLPVRQTPVPYEPKSEKGSLQPRLQEYVSKQPIRTRYLGHVTGHQPIRDQYLMIRSVPARFTFRKHPPTIKGTPSLGVLTNYLVPFSSF
eukprot:sb/3479304/